NLFKQPTTFFRSCVRESVKGMTGRRDGTVDILRAPEGDDSRRLLGSGIDDREFPRLNGIDPAPLYIELPVFVAHRGSSDQRASLQTICGASASVQLAPYHELVMTPRGTETRARVFPMGTTLEPRSAKLCDCAARAPSPGTRGNLATFDRS